MAKAIHMETKANVFLTTVLFGALQILTAGTRLKLLTWKVSERKRLLVEPKVSRRRVTHGEEERARGEKLLGSLNLSISKSWGGQRSVDHWFQLESRIASDRDCLSCVISFRSCVFVRVVMFSWS